MLIEDKNGHIHSVRVGPGKQTVWGGKTRIYGIRFAHNLFVGHTKVGIVHFYYDLHLEHKQTIKKLNQGWEELF